jgi:hypothetical protein
LKGVAAMLMQVRQKPTVIFDERIGVLEACHKRILHFIETLYALAQSSATELLESVDRDSLERSLRYSREAGPRHNANEEESLVPLVRGDANSLRGEVVACLASLANDHRWAEEL